MFRTEMLSATETGGGHFSYLRSTMRLSRALTVCVPGLTVAGIVAASSDPIRVAGESVLALLVALYLVPPALGKLADWERLTRPEQTQAKIHILAFVSNYRAPRTDDVDGLRCYGERRSGMAKTLQCVTLADIACTSLTWTHVLLFALTAWLAWDQQLRVIGIAAAGMGLTALSGWAWWRIVKTYQTYLWLLHRYSHSNRTKSTPEGGGSP